MMDAEISAKYARLRSEIDRMLTIMESDSRPIEGAIAEVLKLGLVLSVATIGQAATAATVGGFLDHLTWSFSSVFGPDATMHRFPDTLGNA